jgi:DNA adenine methylase
MPASSLLNKNNNPKPFLKWAGGKSQLLNELCERLPPNIIDGVISSYVEPFVGGGAMFFHLKSRYTIKQAALYDINPELIMTYKVVKKDPDALIDILKGLEHEYSNIATTEGQSDFFYNIRSAYNSKMSALGGSYKNDWVERAAQIIFLNKTCFNGLFRQNSKGEFNVPFGKYKNPTICDDTNIVRVSRALKGVKLFCKDFEKSEQQIGEGTFVYLDPPYRPLNVTSSFTGYAKEGFDDSDQERLSRFFRKMSERDAYLMLSNSDPRNENQGDRFFDKLYKGFKISRVEASRMINCNAEKRGKISELIITSYKPQKTQKTVSLDKFASKCRTDKNI